MQTQFTASQTVTIPISEQAASIEDYLQEPQRIVHGLTDPSQVELLAADRFRFRLQPLRFLSLEICPTADLQMWSPTRGEVKIRALRCWLEGAEHLNQHFSMQMEGQLQTLRSHNRVRVQGQADLQVTVELPMPFSLTPRPIVEAAGNTLLSGILATIQRRLKQQLRQDYLVWARQQQTVESR